MPNRQNVCLHRCNVLNQFFDMINYVINR